MVKIKKSGNPKSIAEVSGLVKSVVSNAAAGVVASGDAPPGTPREWWLAWDESHRAAWIGGNDRARKLFVEEHSKSNPCGYCRKNVDYIPSPIVCALLGNARFKPRIHDACVRATPKTVLPTWWEMNCPSEFQSTDPDKTSNPKASRAVIAWTSEKGEGLIVHGGAQRGKTRSVWAMLRHVSKTKKVMYADMSRWADELQSRFGDNATEEPLEWLSRQSQVDVLFMDDLDKCALTPRTQVALFSVVKQRCEFNLPIIVTTNALGDELVKKIGDIGRPLVERLRGSCDVVEF